MALILTLHGKTPEFGKNCFIAENAAVIGDVVFGEGCSIWFSTVVRGDVNSIRIGNNVNIQDGAIIHVTGETGPVNIGNNVSIAHNAVVHGCTIHDNVLVGIGAIVMDQCIVHGNVIIAAGAVVTKNTVIETGSVYAGVPAKKISDISSEAIKEEIERITANYREFATWYREREM